MLKVMLADWSFDGWLDILGMQFKSSEGAKCRDLFCLERLLIGNIGASSDRA
jgi:hypothetical protein